VNLDLHESSHQQTKKEEKTLASTTGIDLDRHQSEKKGRIRNRIKVMRIRNTASK
jgi:hypothetical protein